MFFDLLYFNYLITLQFKHTNLSKNRNLLPPKRKREKVNKEISPKNV
ncbi:hypothetical protein HMPREF0346_1796 [Enterococcus faecalis EnGen0297]|nr:hypothetical protein HMPREF0346_1796 [Enterococcus faecalis EnGen0297]